MKRIVSISILTMALCATVFGDCPDADKKRLEQMDRAWGDASMRGDRMALQEVFSDDYVNLSAVGPRTKSEAIDSAVRDAERQRSATSPAPAPTYDMYRITCTPNTAAITHRVTTTNRDGRTDHFRSVHMLEKRAGKWQVVSNAGHPFTDADILADMEQEWADADVRNDLTWYERHYADDFTGISGRTGALRNKADDIAESRNRKERMESAVTSDLNIRTSGDTAVVTGIYHTKGRDEQGKAFDRRMRFADVYVKRDGRWQIWSTQGTPMQP